MTSHPRLGTTSVLATWCSSWGPTLLPCGRRCRRRTTGGGGGADVIGRGSHGGRLRLRGVVSSRRRIPERREGIAVQPVRAPPQLAPTARLVEDAPWAPACARPVRPIGEMSAFASSSAGPSVGLATGSSPIDCRGAPGRVPAAAARARRGCRSRSGGAPAPRRRPAARAGGNGRSPRSLCFSRSIGPHAGQLARRRAARPAGCPAAAGPGDPALPTPPTPRRDRRDCLPGRPGRFVCAVARPTGAIARRRSEDPDQVRAGQHRTQDATRTTATGA